jgi:glyoxylase-like metal-dependent hydrolase (beta-lactamase superfamily II)
VRAVSLHPDVVVVTSALLHANCVVVRARRGQEAGETLVIDSPVLPEELGALPAVIEQAGFPAPSGLLATHGDWDHMLGRLAFPNLAVGCAESTAERLARSPGEAQRELRAFDEELYIDRPLPLALGAVQPLPVPGRLELGAHELQLHPAGGHTPDGMAVWIDWAAVLVVGDYLSPIEIPSLHADERHADEPVDSYLATLGRLRPLLERAEHVVPGHGPVTDGARAVEVLEQDAAYLQALRDRGAEAELPEGRRSRQQRRLHRENVRALGGHA